MKLTEANLKIVNDKGLYRLKIMMPDGSGNYLHDQGSIDVNEAVLLKDLLMDQEIMQEEIKIVDDKEYYRLRLDMHDCNGSKHFFHSRLLNLADVVFERMQLLVADD